MLKFQAYEYYVVKEGQTLQEIARAYHLSCRAIIRENGLQAPPQAGQVLYMPTCFGNFYLAQEGEDKALLCGSERAFEQKNGTPHLYIGMPVVL